MALREITKDITTVKAGIVIHVCNNCGVMGAGVARAIAEAWPVVREQYLLLPAYPLGFAQPVTITPDLLVFNMIAQNGYGREPGRRYLEYGALDACLRTVATFAEGSNRMVYVPAGMGAGLAGGDWSIILDSLDHYVDDCMICVKP